MSSIPEMLGREVEQLLGRAAGPLRLRLVVQPVLATLLAIRAGVRDARAGRPAFLWTLLTSAESRAELCRSGWKDISRLFALAVTVDAGYQLGVFATFHPLQTLIVAVAVAVVPYALLRGPVTRLVRRVRRRGPGRK